MRSASGVAAGVKTLSFPRQLVLGCYTLEFLTEVLDPIFGLMPLKHRHESCNGVCAPGRAQHAVVGIVVDDGPDFELVGHCKRSHR
jgi:hypothetical protein